MNGMSDIKSMKTKLKIKGRETEGRKLSHKLNKVHLSRSLTKIPHLNIDILQVVALPGVELQLGDSLAHSLHS